MNSLKYNLKHNRSQGITLIELLVVVAIISVLTAIMVPRLRVINKDRNIREAARIVGGALAKANARAIEEGVSGLLIERNDNFVDATGVTYGGTRLYLMRKLPPFAGDDEGSEATIPTAGPPPPPGTFVVNIPTPIEHTATNPIIRVGDQIRLNHTSVVYPIVNVAVGTSGGLDLSLSLGLGANLGFGSVRPELTGTGGYPYLIFRQPRKLESTRVDLPDGYMIDVRYSGPLGAFNQVTGLTNDTIELYFNQNGAIDRYAYTDNMGVWDNDEDNTIQGSFYFFITAFEPDVAALPIFSNSNMWVSIDSSTGSVNVAYNAPPPATFTLAEQVQYARGFGRTRESANQ